MGVIKIASWNDFKGEEVRKTKTHFTKLGYRIICYYDSLRVYSNTKSGVVEKRWLDLVFIEIEEDDFKHCNLKDFINVLNVLGFNFEYIGGENGNDN